MPTTTGLATDFVTFSRASTASRINASGLLESVASGVARLDYDPVTLAAKGFLVEEQRTNLLTYSEQFNNAAWLKTNITLTADAVTSPDGTVDADKLEAAVTGSVLTYRSFAAFAGTAATFSIYVKQGSGATEANTFIIRNNTTATNLLGGTLNYSTGVWTYNTGSTGVVVSNAGGGWWRLQMSASSGITSGDTLLVYHGFSGSGTLGQFLYAWGAQLEVGSFATSYIPTVASQVTRNADSATVATSAFPYSATVGSLVAAFTPTNVAAARRAVQLDDGTANQDATIFTNGTPNGAFTVDNGGVAQAALVSGTPAANTTIKIAARFQANDFAMSVNGGTVQTDISGTMPTMNTLRLGSGVSNAETLNGWLRQVTYLPRALTNAELISRST